MKDAKVTSPKYILILISLEVNKLLVSVLFLVREKLGNKNQSLNFESSHPFNDSKSIYWCQKLC